MGHGRGVKKKKRPVSSFTIMTAREIGHAISDCGLTRARLHEISGVDLGAISRVTGSRSYNAKLSTLVDLLAAAGYVIKLERIDPYKDPYYAERRYPPPPLPPKEEKEG